MRAAEREELASLGIINPGDKRMSASLKAVGNRFFVRAYDSGGDKKPWHPIFEGDRIEWKRDGFRGFARAQVNGFCTSGKLQISPVTIDGDLVHGARRRWITARTVAHVYDPATGQRRQPARPQDMEAP